MYCRGVLLRTWLVNDAAGNTKVGLQHTHCDPRKRRRGRGGFVLDSMQMLNEGWMTRLRDFYTPHMSAAVLLPVVGMIVLHRDDDRY